MKPGDAITLTIEKPVAGGRMLARHEGAIVLVAGALPEEVVHARIERVQRGTAWAVVTDVLTASPDRVGEPNPCGGSVFAHARHEAQLRLKQQILADAFARIARMPLEAPVPMTASPPTGYRMRARLHAGPGRLGFYNEGTHDLCDAASTGQLLPATLDVLATLADALSSAPGVVTDVELAEDREGTGRALHLTLAREADTSRLATLSRIDGLDGVSASHAGSARTRELWGRARVSDRFEWNGITWTLERDARSFFQANRYLVDALTRAVVEAVGAAPVLDLYAGVGLFSVAAAAVGKGPVVAVEGDAVSAADLRENAARTDGDVDVRAEPVEACLADHHALRGTGTVIVDPPRTGMSREALGATMALAAPRLIYVSCDVATLARDARVLVDAGYRIASAQGFDMFPNTAHMETVLVFERRKA